MATVLTDNTHYYDIADAIREKLGVNTKYLPSEMAAAIANIETGAELTSADEGKVVVESDGEYVLQAQTSTEITSNGTYDTTTNNEVVVSVSGGGSANIYNYKNEYFCDTEGALLCVLDGFGYYKTTSDPAFVAYVCNGSFTGPLLVSETENGAIYKNRGAVKYPRGTITSNGKTYYVSSTENWIKGDLTSSGGVAQRLAGTIPNELQGQALLDAATIVFTENGSYQVPDGYDGWGDFVIDVDSGGTDLTSEDEGKVVVESSGTYVLQAQTSLNISQNGTYDTTTVNELIANISGGGGGSANILSGTTIPTSQDGDDGNIYILYANTLTNSAGQYINTGYSGGDSSKYVIEFILRKHQSSQWPTPFGARTGDVANSSLVSLASGTNKYQYTTGQWANYSTIPTGFEGADGLIGKLAHIELSAGLIEMSVDGVSYQPATFSAGSISSTSNIGLFAALKNGAYQNWSYTDGMALIYFEVYENSTLVHRFVPAVDSNEVACVYDEIDKVYKYVNNGSLEYVENGILHAYLKVNGSWVPIEGQDIDDVDTGGSGGDVPQIRFKVGASSLPLSVVAGVIGPMANYAYDYIIPVDDNGNDVKLDLSQPFEICCKFSISRYNSDYGNPWGSSNSYYHFPVICVRNNVVAAYVSTSGSRWDKSDITLTPSGYTVPLNTEMIAKLSWDGSDFYFYFNDGNNVYENTLEDVTPYYNPNYTFEFGGQNKSSSSIIQFGASIYFDGSTYLKQGNTIIWGDV